MRGIASAPQTCCHGTSRTLRTTQRLHIHGSLVLAVLVGPSPPHRRRLPRPMGVDGLLSFCASACSDAHVSRFRDQYVAVDASCWLHRGAFACAEDLALQRVVSSKRYLGFALRMLRLLLQHGVKPLIVFDGARAPMKTATAVERHQRREAEAQRGRELLEQGSKAEAGTAFGRGVVVTTEMARAFIVELRLKKIPYIVAPYEADAQLAFLVRQGYAAAAITEDSDLLPYRCPAVLYKLDATGHGRLAQFDDLQWADSNGARLFDSARGDEWPRWRDGGFVDLCCLAGTDYLPGGVPGVGLKTAHSLLRAHRFSVAACVRAHFGLPAAGAARAAPHDEAQVEELVQHLARARETFFRQRVYDPARRAVVMMHDDDASAAHVPPMDEPSAPHLGPCMPDALADAVCVWAAVDPITLADVTNLPPHLPAPVPLPAPAGGAPAVRSSSSCTANGGGTSTRPVSGTGVDPAGGGGSALNRGGANGKRPATRSPPHARGSATHAQPALPWRSDQHAPAADRGNVDDAPWLEPRQSNSKRLSVSRPPSTSSSFLERFRVP